MRFSSRDSSTRFARSDYPIIWINTDTIRQVDTSACFILELIISANLLPPQLDFSNIRLSSVHVTLLIYACSALGKRKEKKELGSSARWLSLMRACNLHRSLETNDWRAHTYTKQAPMCITRTFATCIKSTCSFHRVRKRG